MSDTSMFQILALYLNFDGAKNINVLLVLIWGFGGRWRFLTGAWHPDNYLEMVTGHWYLLHSCSKFWLSILILRVQRTSMSVKYSFEPLEDSGGSLLGLASGS